MERRKANIFILILCCLFLFTSCNSGRKRKKEAKRPKYENVKSPEYENVNRHEEDDGFVWYSCTKNGKTVILNKNHKEIIAPFNGDVYYDKVGRFNIIRYYYNSDRSDSCRCEGVYDKNGKVIISEEEGYYAISVQHPFRTDFYYYSTIALIDGNRYYGLVDKDGNTIIEPFSERGIILYSDNKADDEERNPSVFYGQVNGEKYYIFKEIDENGKIASLGSYIKKAGLIIEEEQSSSGEWLPYPDRDGSIAYELFISDECIIIKKNNPYLEDHIFYRERKDESTYFSMHGRMLVFNLEYEEAFGDIIKNIWRSYTIVDLPNDNQDEIFDDRQDKFRNLRDALHLGAIDYFISQRSDKSKESGLTNTNTGNNSLQPSNVSDNYYSPNVSYPVDAYQNDVEQRQPIRNQCMSCYRNPGTCPVCNGAREVVSRYYVRSDRTIMEPCHHCRGTGKCPACKGDGWIDEGVDF